MMNKVSYNLNENVTRLLLAKLQCKTSKSQELRLLLGVGHLDYQRILPICFGAQILLFPWLRKPARGLSQNKPLLPSKCWNMQCHNISSQILFPVLSNTVHANQWININWGTILKKILRLTIHPTTQTSPAGTKEQFKQSTQT